MADAGTVTCIAKALAHCIFYLRLEIGPKEVTKFWSEVLKKLKLLQSSRSKFDFHIVLL